MDGDAEVEAAVFEVSENEGSQTEDSPPSSPVPRKKKVSRRAAASSHKRYDLSDTIGVNLTEVVPEGEGDDDDDELGFDDYNSDDAFDAIPEEHDDDDDEDDRDDSDPGTSEDEDILPSHKPKKKAPPPKKPKAEGGGGGRDEMSRDTMAVRKQAVAPRDPIKLLRTGDAEPIELPLKCVLTNGTVRSKFRPKEAKMSDLTHIMVNDDDAVHALGVLNTRTDDLTYHELSFVEEQAVIRTGLSSLFNKINYGQLCTEQERWDEMTDGETEEAKLPRKYEGLFPIHTVPMTDRRRAFIVSSQFCR